MGKLSEQQAADCITVSSPVILFVRKCDHFSPLGGNMCCCNSSQSHALLEIDKSLQYFYQHAFFLLPKMTYTVFAARHVCSNSSIIRVFIIGLREADAGLTDISM